MKPNSLFIVGCGDLGLRLATRLSADDYRVTGVCRHPEHLPDDVTGHAADYTQAGSLAFLADTAPDAIVATFKPSEFSELGYRSGFPAAMRNLLVGLGNHKPKIIIMVSSTRVFAERSGQWVDESSPVAVEGYAAQAITEAEQMLRSSIHRGCIVRMAGIYGAPESRLLRRVATGDVCSSEPVRYSNRIHREDCAGFIAHLLALAPADLAPVYIGVDDDPAPQYEVERWLVGRMGVEIKSACSGGDAGAHNKRCSNALLHQSGYTLRYPDYRAGYGAALMQSAEP